MSQVRRGANMIRMACPHCKSELRGDEGLRGTETVCPKCHETFWVPKKEPWYQRWFPNVSQYTTEKLREFRESLRERREQHGEERAKRPETRLAPCSSCGGEEFEEREQTSGIGVALIIVGVLLALPTVGAGLFLCALGVLHVTCRRVCVGCKAVAVQVHRQPFAVGLNERTLLACMLVAAAVFSVVTFVRFVGPFVRAFLVR